VDGTFVIARWRHSATPVLCRMLGFQTLQQSEATLYVNKFSYTSNYITYNSCSLWHCINRKKNNKIINQYYIIHYRSNPHLLEAWQGRYKVVLTFWRNVTWLSEILSL